MRRKNNNKPFVRRNHQIKAREVVVIYNDQNLGTYRTKDAQSLANDKKLDLVEISPNTRPPVCLVVDYGKWLYDKQKRLKKKQKSKKTSLKEVQLRPSIEQHDLDTKISNVRKFLDSGHSVLVSLSFKARQKAHPEEGRKVLEQVLDAVEDIGKPDGKLNVQSKSRMTIRISPKGK